MTPQSSIPAGTHHESRTRGRLVHQACEDIDKGYISADPTLRMYCFAYERFLREHDVRYTHIEQVLWHEKLFYAGTVDRIGILDGERVILDIKSGRNEPWHGIQLSAYELMLPYEHSRRVGLYLRPNGTYRLVEYYLTEEYGVWLTALEAWRIKHGMKPIGISAENVRVAV